jgi:hypothetical protein
MGSARCVAGTPAGGDGPLDADAGQSRPESHAPGLGVFPPWLACTMANSERPQASDTLRNPIGCLDHRTATAPKDQHKGPHRFCELPFHDMLSPLPCPTTPRMANTPSVGVLPLEHVHGCHVTCAPGDKPLVVAWDVLPYLPPPSAASTFLRVARFFWSPSTCCCISTMDDPSSFAEPSAPPIPGTCAWAGR